MSPGSPRQLLVALVLAASTARAQYPPASQATGAINVSIVQFMATPRAPLGDIQVVLDDTTEACTTDSTGTCVFRAVHAGRHIITMSYQGFETIVETVDVAPCCTARAGNIMVGRHPRQFVGIVSDSVTNRPVADAAMVIFGLRNRRLAGDGRTDSAGHYSVTVAESAIASPQPWWFDVVVDHPSYLAKVADFEANGSDTAFVNLSLVDTQGTLVRGTVTDATTGKPITGTEVRTVSGRKTLTGLDGRYELPARPDKDTYYASVLGHVESSAEVTICRGEHARLDFTLEREVSKGR